MGIDRLEHRAGKLVQRIDRNARHLAKLDRARFLHVPDARALVQRKRPVGMDDADDLEVDIGRQDDLVALHVALLFLQHPNQVPGAKDVAVAVGLGKRLDRKGAHHHPGRFGRVLDALEDGRDGLLRLGLDAALQGRSELVLVQQQHSD